MERKTMVSDQEIAKHLETILRQSDSNAGNTVTGVIHQLESELGLNLSQKHSFIKDQINILLQSQDSVHRPTFPATDHFALQPQPHFQSPHPQFHPQFALQNPNQHQLRQVQLRQPEVQQQPMVFKAEANVQSLQGKASDNPKESAPAKKRGGPGGLNKVCGVTPELQVIVGEPALPRTEIVKKLWLYIRKHNLQDPSNKRKIVCDDALRVVFETDCTDMFKMNKLLSKHIIQLEPTKESNQAKKQKVEVDPPTKNAEPGSSVVLISEALANFFGTGEREVLQSEVLRRMWEYIKDNNLEDPMNKMAILCDAKLKQLLGCESISALGIPEMLARHHLSKQQ